ncbi:MAG TPA: hypothetical protein VFW89_07110 [Gemmatimonadaceae bacterium]|nr:hypothetical protein [Gemmatimonadaceae bacterium]
MGSPLDRTHFSDWEHEGELVASDLDSCACALVLGPDAVASAEAALGIARVQARRRRVAVGDVVGELAPIESLLPSESPYGMMDSFLYGVSIAKIAHPVDPARNLFILPSGVGPIDHEAILRSDRWSSLIAGFREAGALLLVIVPAGEESVVALTPLVDGAVLLADADPPAGTHVLAHIRSGAAESSGPAADRLAPAPVTLAPADHTAVSPAAPAPSAAFTNAATHAEPASHAGSDAAAAPSAPAPPLEPAPPELPRVEAASGEAMPAPAATTSDITAMAASTALRHLLRSRSPDDDDTAESDADVLGDHLGDAGTSEDAVDADEVSSLAGRIPRVKPLWVAIAAAVIAGIAILTWAIQRNRAPAPGVAQDSAASAPAAATAAPASGPATTAAVAAGEIANPGDENQAARYAVAMAQVYSMTDANAWLERDKVKDLPATTYTDKPDGARTAYLVLTGAFISRADADSLLRSLRRSGVLKPGQGHIENAPVALMLFGDIPADQAGYTIRGYRSKGIPLYSLYQPDGSVSLYVGAYPTAQSAQSMLAALRRGGDQPRVVYRIGSVR